MSNACSPSVQARLDGLGYHEVLALVRAGVERLRASVLDHSDREALRGSVVELHRLETAVHAAKLRRIREVDVREAWVGAAMSVHGWLADALGLSRGQARGLAEAAAALEALPKVAEQVAEGRVGAPHVAELARRIKTLELEHGTQPQQGQPAERDPGDEASPSDDQRGEPARREAAAAAKREALDNLDERVAAVADDGRRPVMARQALDAAVRDWQREDVPRALGDAEQRMRARRRLWVGRRGNDPDGIGGIGGDLDPMGLATVRAVVHSMAGQRRIDDPRTFGQRCHDALVEVCQWALAEGKLPDVAGEQPRVLLTVEAGALHDDPAARPARLDGYGDVSNDTARQICCDAETTTVAMDDRREVLNVGRQSRHPTRAQRRAVQARDGACIGCGAPVSQCQIHHVEWWGRDRGGTDIHTLVLVCWDCHANIHHNGWQVQRLADGRFVLRRLGDPPGAGQDLRQPAGQASLPAHATRPPEPGQSDAPRRRAG